LEWDPSGTPDPMKLGVSGSCVDGGFQTLEGDSGRATVAKSLFMPKAEMEAATCDVELSLIRTRNGALDPSYGEGGTIVAEQIRLVSLVSTP
jgi:hypothetical protein